MQNLAVVPIFVSAGAAVMPTVIAAAASVGAVLLKPRALAGVVKRRPWVGAIAGVGVVAGVAWMMMGTGSAKGQGAVVAGKRVNWAAVAMDILEQEKGGKVPTTFEVATGSQMPLIEGHDATRASYAGGPSPVKLKQVWRYHPEDAMFLAAPAVAGKRIYVAGCTADLGGYTGILACLDGETGKPLWETVTLGEEVLKPFFSSPAITADGKWLLIGQGLHTDKECALLCVDAATGILKWAAKTPLHIESSPAIFGDMAVVGAGAIEGRDGRPTGDPGFVMAVRISDGKELWRAAVNDPESSPVIDEEGMIYIGSGFNGSAVVALRSGTDAELKEKHQERVAWRAPMPHPCVSAITLIGDLVIAGGGNSDAVHSAANPEGFVAALERKTGKEKWRVPVGDSVLGGVAARGEVLVCGSRTGEVMAIALSDGHVIWHRPISGKSPVIASCSFTGEKVYAVSGDGTLAVLDAKDGKVVETRSVNDETKAGTGLSMSPPQVGGGRVIVGSETGGVRCLEGG